MRQSRGDGRQVRGQRKTEAAVRGRQGQLSYLGLTTGSQQVTLKPPGQGTGCGWISFFCWGLNVSTAPHVILSIRACFLHTGHCVVLLTLACVCLSAFVSVRLSQFSSNPTTPHHPPLSLLHSDWGKLGEVAPSAGLTSPPDTVWQNNVEERPLPQLIRPGSRSC